jgi:hypothetical protein
MRKTPLRWTNLLYFLLYSNYNYASDEMPDSFLIDPQQARVDLGLPNEFTNQVDKSERHQIFKENRFIQGSRVTPNGSRHPGEF